MCLAVFCHCAVIAGILLAVVLVIALLTMHRSTISPHLLTASWGRS